MQSFSWSGMFHNILGSADLSVVMQYAYIGIDPNLVNVLITIFKIAA